MRVMILAGGRGTRLQEETSSRPKPMVEVGGRPVLWHIMKIYSRWGFNDFVVCLGYKGYMVKEYFSNYFLHMSDVTFDMAKNEMTVHKKTADPWRVTLVETGENTQTGGRIKRAADYLHGDETFALTYGDGVSDVNVAATLAFHQKHGRLATVTAVRPARRFGAITVQGDRVTAFEEKPVTEGNLINGGFFILDRRVIDLIDGDETVWERGPMETLAARDELRAHVHEGFWHPMDTIRDKLFLEECWASGKPAWKSW
jgi:glucose-1-phosphate cytidylyltransferase